VVKLKITSPQQLKDLIAELQSAAEKSGSSGGIYSAFEHGEFIEDSHPETVQFEFHLPAGSKRRRRRRKKK
jgi:hypothetical protein